TLLKAFTRFRIRLGRAHADRIGRAFRDSAPALDPNPRRMTAARTAVRRPELWEALVPVVFLVVALALSVINLDELPSVPVLTPFLTMVASIPFVGGLLHASVPVQIPLVAA